MKRPLQQWAPYARFAALAFLCGAAALGAALFAWAAERYLSWEENRR